MASKFKIGDLVWAKLKGFPAWPGKVIQPQTHVKITADKKKKKFVFFYGSENHAWISDENLFEYSSNKSKFTPATRVPKGLPEAMKAIEAAMAEQGYKPVSEESLNKEPEEVKPVKATQKRKPSVDSSKSKDIKTAAGKQENEKRKSITATSGKEKKKNLPSANSLTQEKMVKKKVTKDKAPLLNKEDDEFEMARAGGESKKRPAATQPSGNAVKRTKISAAPRFEINHKDSGIPDVEVKTLDLSNAVYRKPKEIKPSRLKEPLASMYDFNDDVAPQDIIATPMKIGFLGLGIMGSSLVTNLLRSGHEVTVWNRTPSKCKEFVKDGALKCNTPAEVVAQCDITFSCVSDPAAIKDLVFGNSGVLQAIGPEKSFVDMSTLDVPTVEDINEAVMSRGGHFLEAPMITSRNKNERPVILASGEKKLFEDCFSCFAAMGRKALYLGECGCATKMKLALSLLSGTLMAGLAESLALVEKLGLEGSDFIGIIQMSNMNCPLMSTIADDMLQSNYSNAHTKLQSVQKDLRLVVNLSDTVEQPMHVGAAVNEVFKKAKAKGYGEHDVAAVYRAADL